LCSDRYAVRFDEGLDHVIVIDGVPVVDDSKKERLFDTLKKRFRTQTGLDVDVGNFHMPFGEDEKSKG
jgi:translation initiation factor 3 subunit B